MASYVEIIRLFLSSQTLDFRKNTPAYAGNTSDPSSTIPVFRDHPRLRGEYGRLPVPLIVPVGSPPLARGIPLLYRLRRSASGITPLARGIRNRRCKKADQQRITPACAGNTDTIDTICRLLRDHPRLRGEYFFVSAPGPTGVGSPPLARGILQQAHKSVRQKGITPACAGNTSPPGMPSSQVKDHPRLRGEYLIPNLRFSRK